MQSDHDPASDWLSDAGLNNKRDGKVAGPFVKETADGGKIDLSTADPGADDCQINRHQQDGTQNIDDGMRAEPLCAPENTFAARKISVLSVFLQGMFLQIAHSVLAFCCSTCCFKAAKLSLLMTCSIRQASSAAMLASTPRF